MKTKSGDGIFGTPSGQVTVDVPDGVTRTFAGGVVHNTLTNSTFACGGFDGHAYGMWPSEDKEVAYPIWGSETENANVTSLASGVDRTKFRID